MKLTIHTRKEGAELGDLFGIFFEDINHAADGGLYAEMVQNRAFEFAPVDNEAYQTFTAWEKIERDGQAELVAETGNPVSWKNPHYLGLDILRSGKDVGVQNLGYNSGFAFRKGKRYCFSCYARREQDLDKALHVSLRDREGNVYAEKEFSVLEKWVKYELELESPVDDNTGRLAITAEGRGKIYLDLVSLFPEDTYRHRKNGMRKDIAKMLEELHPKFMRFPGGCLVHDGSLDSQARDSQYRWKNTIGPLQDRPARRNNWKYNQTLGLGYYEYFLFCEDIGAKPLPVLPAGYDPHHHREAPLDKLQPWVEDALDLIEFANGSTGTLWGSRRAQLGHPEPFGLEYLGIGNEEVGEAFFERYEVICRAVKAKYPDIKVVGTSGPNAAGGEFERGWEWARRTKTDLVDEHYYQAPEWFLAHHHRYDSYDRKGPRVFLGEYASWGNTWYNALVEASYMIGLERNAEAVGLACYAPLLCNVDYVNWRPDLIWFDHYRVYGTANYYVQKLFMNHQGDRLLEVSAEGMPKKEAADSDHLKGRIRLAGYDSKVKYSDIRVMQGDTGEIMHFPDCIVGIGEAVELAEMDCVNYTVCMKARELEGWKGFQIDFGYRDENNRLFWILGGWQNQDTFVGERIHGRNSDYSQYLLSVEPEREYELKLQVEGRRIETWVDGKRIHCTESKAVETEPLYYSASVETETGDIILKAVNMKREEQKVEICLDGLEDKAICEIYQMYGWALDAQNDFEHPELVVPKQWEQAIDGNAFQFNVPGESLQVFRIKMSETKLSNSYFQVNG